MLLSELIAHLKGMEKAYGDLDVCIASQHWGEHVLLGQRDINMEDEVYAVDDDQEIVSGYEDGKKAIVIGSLD